MMMFLNLTIYSKEFVGDFNLGDDQLIFSSRSETPQIFNFYNLEKLIWHPLMIMGMY